MMASKGIDDPPLTVFRVHKTADRAERIMSSMTVPNNVF